MNRSRSTDAVILRISRIGDLHRGVVMLTPEDGLVRAIAHGANSERGKLRGSTVPFCAGRAYLYTNPTAGSVKITDMDATEFFSGIREDLKRFYTASLWAELLLKTYASGGATVELYGLFRGALEELARRPPASADLVSIQYLWRFLGIAGSRPDPWLCVCTGEPLNESSAAWYVRAESGFCSAVDTEEQGVLLSSGALAFLRHTTPMPLSDSLRVSPPTDSVASLKRVLYTIIQDLVEAPLNTIRTGVGII